MAAISTEFGAEKADEFATTVPDAANVPEGGDSMPRDLIQKSIEFAFIPIFAVSRLKLCRQSLSIRQTRGCADSRAVCRAGIGSFCLRCFSCADPQDCPCGYRITASKRRFARFRKSVVKSTQKSPHPNGSEGL